MPSQLPPTTSATETREPSCQQSHPGSAAALISSGQRYERKTRATATKSARGNVLCGRSTSPANVDAESKPLIFQYSVERQVCQSNWGGRRSSVFMRILGMPTRQSTTKGVNAKRQRAVRKSPTTFEERRFGATKSDRMTSLMPYSTAQPLDRSNMQPQRLTVGSLSSSSSVVFVPLRPPPLDSHVASWLPSVSTPASMPRPAKSCCAAE
mmetsp:Transcript_2197/g.6262  ORF Transcript_2197/g.6262 Transcript_2197/m.6262 type:complete len:210 (-) Transcript_2197:490-1119(-)